MLLVSFVSLVFFQYRAKRLAGNCMDESTNADCEYMCAYQCTGSAAVSPTVGAGLYPADSSAVDLQKYRQMYAAASAALPSPPSSSSVSLAPAAAAGGGVVPAAIVKPPAAPPAGIITQPNIHQPPPVLPPPYPPTLQVRNLPALPYSVPTHTTSKVTGYNLAPRLHLALLLRELTSHMGSRSVTCHPTEVTFPAFSTAEAGTRFIDPRGMRGWVDLGTA